MSYHQDYHGRLRYFADFLAGAHRLPLAVPCRLADLEDAVNALLDTAADWCVLPPGLAEAAGYTEWGEPPHRLHTRLGTFAGNLERIPVHFVAPNSYVLTVEATWFLAPDWPGPPVLGWKGCLERLRFALDPREEHFYFGAW